jgi:hypothetical protein
MAWWAWLILAWLAADCAFVLAWTMRARLRERDAIERYEQTFEDVEVRARGDESVGTLTPPVGPVRRPS